MSPRGPQHGKQVIVYGKPAFVYRSKKQSLNLSPLDISLQKQHSICIQVGYSLYTGGGVLKEHCDAEAISTWQFPS